MADSIITKRALAAALRELMAEQPFEKINVAQICERCNMHRKSFYYHFKDKYDLINWIFDTEIITVTQQGDDSLVYDEHLSFLQGWLDYFYENKDFYRKAFQIRGQNSFAEHFHEYTRPFVRMRLALVLRSDEIDDFYIDFFTDAILCAIERWLTMNSSMTPGQIVHKLRSLVERSIPSLRELIDSDT